MLATLGILNVVEVGKFIGLLGLSAIKFFLAPSIIIYAGYSFWETIALSNIGGISGFFLFYWFGQYIKSFFKRLTKKKRKFKINKRNRRIVKFKNSYGLYGVAILTPCFFSIPLGAFLASAYFSKTKRTVPIFIGSIVIWSFLLTSISKAIF